LFILKRNTPQLAARGCAAAVSLFERYVFISTK